MPDNVKMAREGTTFYDGVVSLSWGTGGDPEVVAAPAAGRSARLVGAIEAGSVVETEDAVTAVPSAPAAPHYVRLSAEPEDGDTLVYNAATGMYDPGAAAADLPTDLAAIAQQGTTSFGRSLLGVADAEELAALAGVIPVVSIRGKTRSTPTGDPIAATTMPVHVVGDLLIAVVACENSRTAASTPTGWTQMWSMAGYMGFQKVATSTSETFTIDLTGSVGQADIQVWSLSPSTVAATTGLITDNSGGTTYTAPAMTVDGSTGMVLLTFVAVAGDRGIYELAGTQESMNAAGGHYSWAPNMNLASMATLSTAINPVAATGNVANGTGRDRYVVRLALVGA